MRQMDDSADCSHTPRPTVVYTDGSCQNDPGEGGWGEGGWGWWADIGEWAYGAAEYCTSNQAELLAAVDAVEHLKGPLIVRSDSTYVTEGPSRRSSGNQRLWCRLADAARGSDVVFEWVRGHSGDRGNGLADALAKYARVAFTAEALTSTSRHQGAGEPGPATCPARVMHDHAPTGCMWCCARSSRSRRGAGADSIEKRRIWRVRVCCDMLADLPADTPRADAEKKLISLSTRWKPANRPDAGHPEIAAMLDRFMHPPSLGYLRRRPA